MIRNYIFLLVLFGMLLQGSCTEPVNATLIRTGAERSEQYMHLLHNKRVGVVVNHTSLAGDEHLVDFLLRHDIRVTTIFSPEHGFRGDADAGEWVPNQTDKETGLPIVSLYGRNKKPLPDQMKNLDILVFDIQDVGCRFYTYITTMHLVMEACAENGKPLIVLDRPNPNGDYIAGPVLDPRFRSDVGMHPIPVVHGCTVGELALMINGEGWLENGQTCELTVIAVENYTHLTPYSLPVKPSPNLPNDLSVRLYPSLCFFEATSVSIGRGTYFPFQVMGYPDPAFGEFSFTPVSIPGMSKDPLHQDKTCYGDDLRNLEEIPLLTLSFFLDYYHRFPDEKKFLTRERWFNLLAGTDRVIRQIREGMSLAEIEQSWEPELQQYRQMREKYLLYPDFL